jgi:DNA-binding response OmpR family regulator
MLNHVSVLVAEDEPFIALDLALAIEDAGGQVIGPAASVKEALTLLAATAVGAAILDVNLLDGDCSAVVEVLAGLDVPIILQTGAGLPLGLAARFPALVVLTKPCLAVDLIVQLEALISDHGQAGGSAGFSGTRRSSWVTGIADGESNRRVAASLSRL